MTPFRRIMLNIFSSAVAAPISVTRPLHKNVLRVINLIRAKTKLLGVNPTIQFDGRVHVVGTRKITIGDYSRIGREVELGTEESGVISIGSDVRINRGTTVFAYSSVTIGDHTLIGEYCTIRDANHGIDREQLIKYQEHGTAAIVIEADVWIGRGSCVLPGVTIGKGAIVGANSVVTKSVPEYSVVAGAPARVIRGR